MFVILTALFVYRQFHLNLKFEIKNSVRVIICETAEKWKIYF
jgi:hypothetical protein